MALMLGRTDDLCCEIQEKDNIRIEHVDKTAKEMISDFLPMSSGSIQITTRFFFTTFRIYKIKVDFFFGFLFQCDSRAARTIFSNS